MSTKSATKQAQATAEVPPTLTPPQTSSSQTADSGTEMAAPTLIPGGQQSSESTSSSDASPALAPPSSGAQGQQTENAAVGAWLNDKRVSGLWSIAQNRNGFVYITGVGWKKLANNSDSAIVALNQLSAHARLTQTSYNYREEADGMIHEVYVW